MRLFRDQTFNISASSRFKMYMECAVHDGRLRLHSLATASPGDAVELQVGVSLPNGLTDLSGQPVRHLRLRAATGNAPYFQPGFYVDRRAPGVLHFEVTASADRFMLSPGVAGPLPRQRHRDLGLGSLMGRCPGRACLYYVMRFKGMKLCGVLLGLSVFSLAVQAGPQINVGTVYDYLDGDKSTYLKRVFNSGDSTAFVKVNILEIVYDADGSTAEIPVADPADGSRRAMA